MMVIIKYLGQNLNKTITSLLAVRIKLKSLNQTCISSKLIMHHPKTILLDSSIRIVSLLRKKVANRRPGKRVSEKLYLVLDLENSIWLALISWHLSGWHPRLTERLCCMCLHATLQHASAAVAGPPVLAKAGGLRW
jgi:hypothetical protein